MAMEKKPHRRLCRRQKHLLQVPIGVSFRQQHLQRTMLYAFRRVKGEATKKEMKSQGKERVELTELEARFIQLEARFTELEARFTQLRAESGHALEESSWTQLEARFTQLRAESRHAMEESAWTQTCLDTVEALLVAEDMADQLRDPLSGH
ncbi:hypothetical protein SLE2022_392960 [Rubroshorea leprosula]